jgi:hypothetical protein
MLTYEKLHEILSYDRETGIFTWKVKTAQRVHIGQRAGSTSSGDGYEMISINNKLYKSHRLAWLYEMGSFPDVEIDHINRIRTDNRFCNLRLASKKQNMENTTTRKDNKSGMTGVSWSKATKKWRAYVTHNRKQMHLGTFESKEDAINMANNKRKELYTHYESKA